MASNKSRSSGVTAAQNNTTTVTPQVPVQQVQPSQVVQQTQQAQNANNAAFSDTDASDYHDLFGGRNYFLSQQFGIDSEVARQTYLRSTPESSAYGGDDIHSPSQNMNWEMMNNLPMHPTHTAMRDGLMDAMHNLGYNLNLQRYDHGAFVDRLLKQAGGGGTTTTLSESQLKKALVGRTFSENRFLSTSYNNFKNATNPSTFTTREVRIEYRAKASVQAFMPGDGQGGRLGEIIGAPNTQQRIVDVKVSPTYNARAEGSPPGTQNRKQITLVVELG